MPLIFVDQPVTFTPRHGNAVMTLKSGDEEIQILLTRHALASVERRAGKTWAALTLAGLENEPHALPSKARRR
jgi:muramidase (phage lysozyme)